MGSLSDDVASATISCGRWERMQALCNLHAEIVATVEDSRTLENLALLEVIQSLLQMVATAPKQDRSFDKEKDEDDAEPVTVREPRR
jgi:hypothetical protein